MKNPIIVDENENGTKRVYCHLTATTETDPLAGWDIGTNHFPEKEKEGRYSHEFHSVTATHSHYDANDNEWYFERVTLFLNREQATELRDKLNAGLAATQDKKELITLS